MAATTAAHRDPARLTSDEAVVIGTAIAEPRAAIGPIAVPINNVANDVRHDFASTTADEFERNVAVNLRHQYVAIQAVLDDMKALREIEQ